MTRLQVVGRALPFPVCVGLLTGLWIASQEISAHRYFAQGLWRTALWIAARDTMAGAAVGAATGVLLALALIRGGPSAALQERRLELATVLLAMLGLAIGLLPTRALEVFGYSAQAAFGAGLSAFWVIATATLLARTSEETSVTQSVEGVWTVIVWLIYLTFLAHVWARVEPSTRMAFLACGGLLGALAAYAVLSRPAQGVARVMGERCHRPTALRKMHWLSVTVMGLALALWLAGGAEARRVRSRLGASPRNLLIIAVDTLRADHVSLPSPPVSGWDLTPNLRKHLAHRGTYFTRAHAQASWTMPSFASMLTGLYPEEHGAQLSEDSLLPHRLTLAEVLRDQGYQTMAVVSGDYVSSQFGMLQGFEATDESQVLDRYAITSREVTDRALHLLSTRSHQPFFLFAHYYDPHWQYQDHAEFALADPSVRLMLPEKLNRLSAPAGIPFSPEELAKLKALYAEDIAYTDLHIGRLLSYLDQKNLRDSTVVVFVADHGDEFQEHGGFEHGHTLFGELVHVPLLVADPGRSAPSLNEQPVETRWLFGTILNSLGLRRPTGCTETPDLFSLPKGEYYLRASLRAKQSSLMNHQYKLITGEGVRLDLRPQAGPGGVRPRSSDRATLLFDLLNDPGERRDLSEALPEVKRELSAVLQSLNTELSGRAEQGQMPRLSEEQKRRLRALGYL